eukprot:CAMPEP_0168564608 /NCGR_PEP_ID=MMETSP0413-20121227/13343_1 /TAXON_ID=136452 /ORGANISM="Filamoeba nolandi, Strain NC-AS-23-1" /LENGTH=600 /DNA_ID=CAMNT_0008596305 /DNA_START=47 /DNA_END=1846 /DNA_ORIENTATION=-
MTSQITSTSGNTCRPLRRFPTSGFRAVQGKRPTMEDTHVVIDDLDKFLKKIQQENSTTETENPTKNEIESENSNNGETKSTSSVSTDNNNSATNHINNKQRPAISFYAVYDGHGGVQAANMCEDIFHKNLIATEEFQNNNMEEAISKAFEKTDKQILEKSVEECWTSGSTAVMVLLYENTLWVANAGDSEAVLARKRTIKTTETDPSQTTNNQDASEYEPILLTYKHKPTENSEKERIRKAGGHVVFGRVMGSLAVARSFGDRDFKFPYNKAEGDFVSALPYIQKLTLDPQQDHFLIISCDGLWDRMSYEYAVDLVSNCRNEGKTAQQTADILVQNGIDRGSLDNVTAIVVYLPSVGWHRKKKTYKPDGLMDAYEFLRSIQTVEEFQELKSQLEPNETNNNTNNNTDTSKENGKLKGFNLPGNETLLEQSTCFLEGRMLDNFGTLFLTQNYLCFSSHNTFLFGKRVMKKIGHDEIIGVETIGNSAAFTLKVTTKDGKQSLFSWKGQSATRESLCNKLMEHQMHKPKTQAEPSQSTPTPETKINAEEPQTSSPSHSPPQTSKANEVQNANTTSAEPSKPQETKPSEDQAKTKLAWDNWSRF